MMEFYIDSYASFAVSILLISFYCMPCCTSLQQAALQCIGGNLLLQPLIGSHWTTQ